MVEVTARDEVRRELAEKAADRLGLEGEERAAYIAAQVDPKQAVERVRARRAEEAAKASEELDRFGGAA